MPRKSHTSHLLFERALRLFPGGVNSPVRAFRAVGGEPPFIVRGRGPLVWDADGNEYIDYVGSWGPLILGHAHKKVVDEITRVAASGTSFGAPTPLEVELGSLVQQAFPSMELLRFVSSGTEACMSALRAARGYTGRSKVIKFDGCYHGHADGLLVKAGSGGATLGVPDSAGVPESYAQETLVAPYNDLAAVETLFKRHLQEIAAVIVEPVAANMGVVPPKPGFLQGLRDLTTRYGALLIFDEVITGFRIGLGGAQEKYGVTPDLTCLGKIIGGGMPVGAYGGAREIMQVVAPLGQGYQAGTLSGNPVAMAAGLATLKALAAPGTYDRLEETSAEMEAGLREALAAAGRQAQVQRIGSVLTLFFTPRPVTSYAEARSSDTALYARFFHAMLEGGVYLPPSQFEAWFVSLAHGDAEVQATLKAAQVALQSLS